MENHHSQWKTAREGEMNKEQGKQNWKKTINKSISKFYLSVITFCVDGLISPIKRHSVAGWIKNKTNDMLFTIDSLHLQRQT